MELTLKWFGEIPVCMCVCVCVCICSHAQAKVPENTDEKADGVNF